MIPGVAVYHPRAEWEPSDLRRDTSFHRTPAKLVLTDVDKIACHYTAATNLSDGDPGETVAQVGQFLARAHLDYLVNRTGGGYRRLTDDRWFPGYPLGYSFAFDHWGGVWQINGFDYRPAATSGHNTHTLAFLMMTDRADPGSDAMWASFRAVAREARRRGAPLDDRPWAHGWFKERTGVGTTTACCGPALKAQIDQGLGDLSHQPPQPEPPTPEPPPEDDDMPPFLIRYKGIATFLPDGTLVTDETAAVYAAANVPIVDSDPATDIQFHAFLDKAGPAAAFELGKRAAKA